MIEKLKEFAAPYYAGKDIMHNMWHIELVANQVPNIETILQIAWESQRSEVPETLEYLKHNVIDKQQCYLPETKKMCEKMNGWPRQFVADLEEGILL